MADSNNHNLSAFTGSTKGGSLAEFALPPFSPVRSATRRISSVPLGRNAFDESLTVGSGRDADSPPVSRRKAGSPGIPFWKRALDISCVALTAPLWLPLMVFISVWIKVFSSGPVFFKQTRIGLRGEPFTMLKFRSMKAGVETATHEEHFKALVKNGVPMTKLDALKDSRIIPGGRLLRSTGLDELPQLFNVFRGQMSLVGPRPCTPAELECYVGRQRERFDILPGLTGYWQVSGKNKTTFAEMVEMDLKYRERVSFFSDMSIIIRTVPALAKQAMEARSQRGRKQTDEKPPESGATEAA
jgi:lipopolysaccharide/colanic/teichoic acid biosynthesis glycosyltransferase